MLFSYYTNHTIELQSAADIVSLLFKVTNGRKIIKLKHLQKLLFELTILLMGDIHYRMILWEKKFLTQIIQIHKLSLIHISEPTRPY